MVVVGIVTGCCFFGNESWNNGRSIYTRDVSHSATCVKNDPCNQLSDWCHRVKVRKIVRFRNFWSDPVHTFSVSQVIGHDILLMHSRGTLVHSIPSGFAPSTRESGLVGYGPVTPRWAFLLTRESGCWTFRLHWNWVSFKATYRHYVRWVKSIISIGSLIIDLLKKDSQKNWIILDKRGSLRWWLF